MRDPDDPAGRRTRAFWHHFPRDGEWRKVTLAAKAALGFKLEPCCRNCHHKGPVMTPEEVAAWAGVPMATPVIWLAARLVCSQCDYPAGYFYGHNPHVRARDFHYPDRGR